MSAGRSVASARRVPRRVWAIGGVLVLLLLSQPAHPLRTDNFVFYLPQSHQVIPIESITGEEYLPVLSVLNLAGTVSGLEEKGNSLKLFLGQSELQLHNKDRKVRLNGGTLKLSSPVLVSNGRWMVPLEFVDAALPKLTGQRLEHRPGDRRAFIGDVRAATLSVQRSALPEGTRLTLHFSQPETVHAMSSNGKWVLLLQGDPIEPVDVAPKLQGSHVSEVQFDDSDGSPKLIITPAGSGLNFYSSVAEQGRQFQADIVQGTAVASQTPSPPPGPAPFQAGAASPAAAATAPSLAPRGAPAAPGATAAPALPVVVLDAGHGGADPGARSRDGVAEKDLAAALVARVRDGLAAGNRWRVLLTRAGDSDPSFDERDAAANLARPVAFLTFHAGNLGQRSPRVMLYTYQASSAPPAASAPALFAPWDSAQEPYLERSRQLAGDLEKQMTQAPGLSAGSLDEAPVRQLRSVAAPAVALEVGSLRPDLDAGPLSTPDFQAQVAAAVVRALEAFRGGSP